MKPKSKHEIRSCVTCNNTACEIYTQLHKNRSYFDILYAVERTIAAYCRNYKPVKSHKKGEKDDLDI